jgi:hypothetical protein
MSKEGRNSDDSRTEIGRKADDPQMPRKPPKDDDQVAQLVAHIAGSPARGRGKRSPLFNWLMAHKDAFSTMLSQHPANWDAIANGLRALGLTDGKDSAPTAERVRKTWWLVRHKAAAQREGPSPAQSNTDGLSRTVPRSASLPAQLASMQRTSMSVFDPDAIDPDIETEAEFRPARPRNWTQPAIATPPQESESHDGDNNQKYAVALRRLTERARARALPMPPIPTAEDE